MPAVSEQLSDGRLQITIKPRKYIANGEAYAKDGQSLSGAHVKVWARRKGRQFLRKEWRAGKPFIIASGQTWSDGSYAIPFELDDIGHYEVYVEA